MKKIFLAIASFSFHMALFSNIGPDGFVNFPNHYFIETGTHHGAGIAKALQAGFKEIRSIDIDQSCINEVSKQYADNPSVKLYVGDSAYDLWTMMNDIREPITFWLDGHNIYPTPGTRNCPLLAELEQIKWHPIKNHTIIIDDMHCLGTLYFDYMTRNDLITKILEINPNYRIFYIVGGDSGSHPNNIMVAMYP